MFGYVKINKPEMKVKEYEAYRGIYCSLCKTMRKNFGVLSALTLSYDITFLAAARMAFQGKVPSFKGGICPYNPTKKCNYCKNCEDELLYAAAVSVMMTYYKIKDNIADGSFFEKILMYLLLPLVFFKFRKAEKLFPEVAFMIKENIERQAQTEKSMTDSTDKAAHETADMLGRVFSYGLEKEKGKFYRFGYGVGKWIYLCDGAEDIEKDIKKKSYNVFAIKHGLSTGNISDEIKEEIKGSLNMSLAFAEEAWRETENKTMIPIIENIIYDGMNNVMNNILKGKDEDERSL